MNETCTKAAFAFCFPVGEGVHLCARTLERCERFHGGNNSHLPPCVEMMAAEVKY